MKIRTKLVLWSVAVILIIGSISFIGIRNYKKTQAVFGQMRDVIIPMTESMWGLVESSTELRHQTMEYIMRGGDKKTLISMLDRMEGEWAAYKRHEFDVGEGEKLVRANLDAGLGDIRAAVLSLVAMKEGGADSGAIMEYEMNRVHPAVNSFVAGIKKHEAECRSEIHRVEGEIGRLYGVGVKELYAAAGVSSLLLLFLAAGMVLKISGPLEALRNAVLKVGAGKLDEKVEVKTGGEIGELASAFNKMVDEVRESREEIEDWGKVLEQKVAEKTGQIAAANEELRAMNEELRQSNEEMLARNEEMAAMTEELRATNEVLSARTNELEAFRKVTVGREKRVIELKERVKELEAKLANSVERIA